MKKAIMEIKTMRLFFVLFAGFSVFVYGMSFSADIPAFAPLAPITVQVNKPTIVTLDEDGRVYVAETGSNLVRIFSQSGSHIHTISGLSKPTSLAVDVGGRIYIGNRDQGNVEVYDASYNHLFNLGQGTDEFGLPNDIDIDASGLIYVVDKTNSAIKLYNSDGTYNSSLGESGNGNGQFHHPVSLAIDTAGNELVVLDLQERLDQFSNTMIDGARIQFLQMNGDFKRGYSKFGYDRDNGELVMPMHIAVDDESRVYVSESRLQKVMVYENTGGFLGMIDNASHPLRTPLGIAMGKTNKLYVSSLLAGQIDIYGIDGYLGMTANPASLSFEELQGNASGTMKPIAINNTGNSVFNWTASTEESWLTLPATEGTIPEAGQSTVNVGVEIDGLTEGEYEGSVTITAGMAASETIAVSLTILPHVSTNFLSISPASLGFSSTVGTTPACQTLSVKNTGGGTLNWNANVDQSWLTVDATSGTAPFTLKVYADVSSLAAGSYSGTVTVTRQGGTPEMKIIPVTLTLSDPPEPPIEPPPGETPESGTKKKRWTTTQILFGTSLYGIWGNSRNNLLVVGDEGSILRYNGQTWSDMVSGVTAGLFGIWGSSAEDVYAVGENGVVLHYDGSNWSPLPVVVQDTLRDTWGCAASDVYAVSRVGYILQSFSSATDSNIALRGIWGSSDADLYVAGENGIILHYDGNTWTSIDSDTTEWLNGIWGSSESDIFAVGENGAIVHYDGATWESMDSGTTVPLKSVWGNTGSDVFAVGAGGLILHYNGVDWHSVTTAATDDLNDVWVSDKSEVFAVGENGTVVFGVAKSSILLFMQNIIMNNAEVKKRRKEEMSAETDIQSGVFPEL